MQVYLVGGAIRNKMLKLPVKDLDYVVVGSSTQEMLNNGFTQVGSHFPVFLHPDSKQEYALARTEHSTGEKHTDFECVTDNVSLRDDLFRRDFTINALAHGDNGEVYDYFNGLDDLNSKTLRHISKHFKDDPLRILRCARFAAQLDFSVADETIELMKQMVSDNMLATLPVERIKGEFDKALMSDDGFDRFIQVLAQVGALNKLQHAFNIGSDYYFEFSRHESYSERIMDIVITCAEFRLVAFPCKTFIGAKLYKQTQYLFELCNANISFETCIEQPEYVLKFVNQTVKEMLVDSENRLQFMAIILWHASEIMFKLYVINGLIQQMYKENFTGLSVEQIKNKKLHVVKQYGLSHVD